jgi:hypothetical protein
MVHGTNNKYPDAKLKHDIATPQREIENAMPLA